MGELSEKKTARVGEGGREGGRGEGGWELSEKKTERLRRNKETEC